MFVRRETASGWGVEPILCHTGKSSCVAVVPEELVRSSGKFHPPGSVDTLDDWMGLSEDRQQGPV